MSHFVYLGDAIQQFCHGLAALQLGLLHRLQFNQHCINLGNDAPNRVFHAIHATAQPEKEPLQF